MNPEFARIRGYLNAQGAKLSPEQIIGKVQEAMGQLRAAATAVPAARDTTPRPLSEWWTLLERDRDALFARVRSAHPMSRLEATIPHPFFGALNWRETLLFIRLHDLDHAGQLQKVAAAF